MQTSRNPATKFYPTILWCSTSNPLPVVPHCSASIEFGLDIDEAAQNAGVPLKSAMFLWYPLIFQIMFLFDCWSWHFCPMFKFHSRSQKHTGGYLTLSHHLSCFIAATAADQTGYSPYRDCVNPKHFPVTWMKNSPSPSHELLVGSARYPAIPRKKYLSSPRSWGSIIPYNPLIKHDMEKQLSVDGWFISISWPYPKKTNIVDAYIIIYHVSYITHIYIYISYI